MRVKVPVTIELEDLTMLVHANVLQKMNEQNKCLTIIKFKMITN